MLLLVITPSRRSHESFFVTPTPWRPQPAPSPTHSLTPTPPSHPTLPAAVLLGGQKRGIGDLTNATHYNGGNAPWSQPWLYNPDAPAGERFTTPGARTKIARLYHALAQLTSAGDILAVRPRGHGREEGGGGEERGQGGGSWGGGEGDKAAVEGVSHIRPSAPDHQPVATTTATTATRPAPPTPPFGRARTAPTLSARRSASTSTARRSSRRRSSSAPAAPRAPRRTRRRGSPTAAASTWASRFRPAPAPSRASCGPTPAARRTTTRSCADLPSPSSLPPPCCGRTDRQHGEGKGLAAPRNPTNSCAMIAHHSAPPPFSSPLPTKHTFTNRAPACSCCRSRSSRRPPTARPAF